MNTNVEESAYGRALTEKDRRPTIVAPKGKWYCLRLVVPGDVPTVEDLPFSDLELGFDGTAWCDHVVNPMAVCHYAARKWYQIDKASLAEIATRWYNEYYDLGWLSEDDVDVVGGRCISCGRLMELCVCEADVP